MRMFKGSKIYIAEGWDRSKPDGASRKLLDSSNFMTLGWKPTTLLNDGLKITYEWFKKSNNI